MDIKIINDIVSLVLERTIGRENLCETQRETLSIEKMEITDNNKYISFYVDGETRNTCSLGFSPLSVMFWELTQNIPIECILFYKDGCIYSLEAYSCDGSPFETIYPDNIDIRTSEPSSEVARS